MRNCFAKCFRRKPQNGGKTGKNLGLRTEPDGNELFPKADLARMNSLSKRVLTTAIYSCILFREISDEALDDLVNDFKLNVLRIDTNVVEQGSLIQNFFVIESGNLDIIVNGKISGQVSGGYFVGEMSLLTHAKSNLTVKTASKVKLWTLSRQDFERTKQKMQNVHKYDLLCLMNEVPLFMNFSEDLKARISESAFLINYKEKEYVCKVGEASHFLYLLKDGRVGITVNDKIMNNFYEGNIFGELPLIDSSISKRLASIQCQIDSKVYLFEFNSIKSIVGHNYEKIFLQNIVLNCLTRDNHSKYLSKALTSQVVNLFSFSKQPAGSIIIDGTRGISTSFYIVCLGSISSMKNTFKSYTLIGFQNENHLKIGTGRYRSDEESVIAEVEIKEIEKVMKTSIDKFVNHAQCLNLFQMNQFFNTFSLENMEILMSESEIQEYPKDSFIYETGENDEFVYFIKQGSVGMYENDIFSFRFDEGSTFGESCLKEFCRSASAKALKPVVCHKFPKAQILKYMEESTYKFIDRVIYLESFFDMRELMFLPLKCSQPEREFYKSQSIKSTHKYLVEIIYKKKIYLVKDFQLILNQKCVLSMIDHPYIPRYVRSLSDLNCVYFFYEYFDHVLLSSFRKKKLGEASSKFIFLNLLDSVNYLHNKGILHRDINPENICLDSKGYAKLTGFKYSKLANRSYTLLDTDVEYKAVETICTGVYTRASELWSCGIILYELMKGKSPFGLLSSDTYNEKAEKIINFRWKNISKSVSSKTQSIVKNLLNPKPAQRMTMEDVLNDKWSKEFRFNQQFKDAPRPVFKPKNVTAEGMVGGRNSFKPLARLTENDKKNRMIFEWDVYF